MHGLNIQVNKHLFIYRALQKALHAYDPTEFDYPVNLFGQPFAYNRVQVFSSMGEYLMEWGSKGSRQGQFEHPQGITVDSADNIYVTDAFNNRVQVFDSAGEYIMVWGSRGTKDGEFRHPEGIAVDSAGNVYAGDFLNGRVQTFRRSPRKGG